MDAEVASEELCDIPLIAPSAEGVVAPGAEGGGKIYANPVGACPCVY